MHQVSRHSKLTKMWAIVDIIIQLSQLEGSPGSFGWTSWSEMASCEIKPNFLSPCLVVSWKPQRLGISLLVLKFWGLVNHNWQQIKCNQGLVISENRVYLSFKNSILFTINPELEQNSLKKKINEKDGYWVYYFMRITLYLNIWWVSKGAYVLLSLL